MKNPILPLLFLLLCATPAHAGDRIDVHEYTIWVDYSLSRLWVEAQYASPVKSIMARSRNAGKYLIDVSDCNQQQSIRLRNRRMMLPEGGIRCINYSVDLSKAAGIDENYDGLSEGNAIISPSLWLWRPELNSRTEIRARFRLPHDMKVSVPWQPLDRETNAYRIGASPESSNAPVMFGNFEYRDVEIPGATLRVGLARRDIEVDADTIFDWVGASASDVALAYGRFPNPSPQVIVIPVDETHGDSAVPFGRVIRDGGETVQLFVAPNRPIGDYLGDWTATHEFSHLMLPYLNKRHRWISEGFAQYYQNVLLARAGAYDEQYAWQKIVAGFERGRLSRPELSPNEAAEGDVRTGLMKVYWSGAAIALMADVQLRERSGGDESLDTVLGKLQDCCLPANSMWSGTDLFGQLDALIGEPVFMPLYRRYANTAGFPDTSELIERLGIEANDGVVRIRRSSDLAKIRIEITGQDPAGSRRRQKFAAR